MEEKEKSNSCDSGNDKWIKFALIVAAVFLGCYLATYYLVDQMRHQYYYTHIRPIPNIDDVLREQDKFFDSFNSEPISFNLMLPVNESVVQTFKKDDEYKMIIDLKPFGGSAENIKLKIKSDKVSISGENFTSKKNSESNYSFSQSFTLPEKIDTSKVKKEIVKDQYIITLPIKD